MKTHMKLNQIMPVLSDEVKNSLRELELEHDGFTIDNAELKRVAVSSDELEIAEGERAAVKYISTRDVDRIGEVMVPSGAELKQYYKNPVVLWAHDYSQPPIGKSEWIRVDDYGLKSKTVYASTERAEEIWQLVKGEFIKTSSIGFISIESTWKGASGWQQLIDKYNAEWNTDLEKDGAWIITTKWVLLEYSDVPVPMNPNALITAVAKGLTLSPTILGQLGVDVPDVSFREAEKAVKETARKLGIIEVISEDRWIVEVIDSAHNLIVGE